MNVIRKKIAILKHRYTWGTLPIIGLWTLVGYPCVAMAQYPQDEIPVLDLNQSQKAVVVRLNFTGSTTAALDSAEVFFGRAHGRAGGPPMLGVEVRDLNGNITQQFNAWHPLKVFVKDDAGLDKLVTRTNATGSIIFPFAPNVASVTVKDKRSQSEIISVDLLPVSHGFCRDNRNDPDCGQVVNRPPNCNAGGPYRVECAGKTTAVKLDGGGCSDPDRDPLTYAWTGAFIGWTASGVSPTVQFPGFGDRSANLEVTDDFGGTTACSSAVSVVDTTPPAIEGVDASPKVLWPPFHQMIPVKVDVVSLDICDPVVTCQIAFVTSNEPVNGLGDGDKAPDWVITGNRTLNLRSERSGLGSGRIYRITVTCTDTSGNSTSRATTVTVPHDLVW